MLTLTTDEVHTVTFVDIFSFIPFDSTFFIYAFQSQRFSPPGLDRVCGLHKHEWT